MEKDIVNTNTNKAGRVVYIDAVAGIMIIWMILCHVAYFSHISLPSFIKYLGFYMPWFFYKSGMFFSKKNQVILLRKDASKLLRYFVVYSVVGWFIWCVCGLTDSSLTLRDCLIKPISVFFHTGGITGNGALWFLLSLFIVRQSSNFLVKTKIPPPIFAIICYIIAYMLYYWGVSKSFWWIGNVFSGMCFFLLGYWLKDKEGNSVIFVISIITYGLILCAYWGSWIDDFPFLYMHANRMYYGNFFLFLLMASAGIIMTNNIFKIVTEHIRLRLLEYIGKNAMNIYVTHWILFTMVIFVTKYCFNVNMRLLHVAILLLSSILFLPILNNIIKTLKTKNYFKYL